MSMPLSWVKSDRRAEPLPSAESAQPSALAEPLSALYRLAQQSQAVFGSPLGPFFHDDRHYSLPRFVYFGPHTSDESLRLAFIAGYDRRDLRSTLALLHFVELLARAPDIGQGLHLAFFPIVDVLGLAGVSGDRALHQQRWSGGAGLAPELALLEQDARLMNYHGFIHLETAPGDEVITVRLRGGERAPGGLAGVELISSDEVEPFHVRWESEPSGTVPTAGPLTVADDLAVAPFELHLSLPSHGSAEQYLDSVVVTLRRFILRYRGLQAYAQHL